jgi:hypothetical protein
LDNRKIHRLRVIIEAAPGEQASSGCIVKTGRMNTKEEWPQKGAKGTRIGEKFFERNGYKPTRTVSRVKKGWKTLCCSGFDNTSLSLFFLAHFAPFCGYSLFGFHRLGYRNLPPLPDPPTNWKYEQFSRTNLR